MVFFATGFDPAAPTTGHDGGTPLQAGDGWPGAVVWAGRPTIVSGPATSIGPSARPGALPLAPLANRNAGSVGGWASPATAIGFQSIGRGLRHRNGRVRAWTCPGIGIWRTHHCPKEFGFATNATVRTGSDANFHIVPSGQGRPDAGRPAHGAADASGCRAGTGRRPLDWRRRSDSP